MIQFLKKILFFSLPVIFGCVFLEYSLRKIPNDYSKKSEYLTKHASSINTLFLGNSHIYYGINPIYIKRNSYNASYVSQSFDLDLAILNKFEKNWDSLKYIAISVDYFGLFRKLSTGVENWRLRDYQLNYGIGDSNDWSMKTELIGNFRHALLKFLRFYIQHQKLVTTTDLGWGTGYSFEKRQDLVQTGISASKKHLKINNISFESNIISLNKIIEFAKTHHIKVLLLTLPAYQSYSTLLNTSQLNLTEQTALSLVRQNKNVTYYNLMNDTDFVDKDFYDADHLNEFGAKKLTLKIDSLLFTY